MPRLLPNVILTAIDLHGCSDHAVEAALWLSRALGARCQFVHAFPPRPILWGREVDLPEWSAGLDAAAQAVRTRIATVISRADPALRLGDIDDDFALHVGTGRPAHVIAERVRETGADWIVLGAHSRRGIVDFGSTTRAVLGATECALWQQVEPLRVPRRLLVPIDSSDGSRHALVVARDLALAVEATLTVLHVFVPPELGAGVRRELADVGPTHVLRSLSLESRLAFEESLARFDWGGVVHEELFAEGDPAERILELAQQHDLIVMSTHGRSRVSRAVLGSVSYSVLRSAHAPVLALRPPGSAP